ncbi:hypothetical protein BH09MYX1_BH09MYX1_55750 [soil metagenome]
MPWRQDGAARYTRFVDRHRHPRHYVGLAIVVAVSAMACAPPATPLLPVTVTPVPLPPPVDPPPPRTERDRDSDFVRAWASWTAGERTPAITAFRALAKELGELPRDKKAHVDTRGIPSSPIAVSDDGAHAAALSGGGVYYFDDRAVPIRYDVAIASSVEFIPKSSLAVLSGEALVIVDTTSFARALRAADVSAHQASASGKSLVYQEKPTAGSERVHLWDVATMRDRRVFTLAAGESIDGSAISFSPDEKELSVRIFGDAGAMTLAVFDEGGGRIDFPSSFDAMAPSYSSDGKYFAYGYPTREAKGPSGKTVLFDRATRKIVATTNSSKYPTATQFSKSGKLLIVGDLRRLSIMDVPSLRTLATTPYLREFSGLDDDLQNITDITILGADVGFSAHTSDFTFGVFRLPSAALVWKGRGESTALPNGALQFVDREEKHAVTTIDPKLGLAQRPLSRAEIDAPYPTLDDPAAEKLRARLEKTVCTVRERVFPIEACN